MEMEVQLNFPAFTLGFSGDHTVRLKGRSKCSRLL